jgi:uncharacterized membrane protein YeaQ/YmgE (transglycosylase-associated protein family)
VYAPPTDSPGRAHAAASTKGIGVMNYLSWLVLGLIAGFVGSKIVNKSGAGLIEDVVLGVIGAVVCGYIGTLVGIGGVSGLNLSSLFSLVVALVGALVALTVYRSVAARS